MNYLKQIIYFNEYLRMHPLSAGQISLWYALMWMNNKCGWIEWFSAANKVLEINTGLSRSGIYKARDVLKERGLIDYRFNEYDATEYHIIPITLFENSNRGSNILNKQNKTKQNKTYYNKYKNKFNNCDIDEETLEYYKKLEESVFSIMLSEDN